MFLKVLFSCQVADAGYNDNALHCFEIPYIFLCLIICTDESEGENSMGIDKENGGNISTDEREGENDVGNKDTNELNEET